MNWYENPEVSAAEVLSHITLHPSGEVNTGRVETRHMLAELQKNPALPLLVLEDPRLIPVQWAAYEEWSDLRKRELLLAEEVVCNQNPATEEEIEAELYTILQRKAGLHPILRAAVVSCLEGFPLADLTGKSADVGLFSLLPQQYQTIASFMVAHAIEKLSNQRYYQKSPVTGYQTRSVLAQLQAAVSFMEREVHCLFASVRQSKWQDSPAKRYVYQQKEIALREERHQCFVNRRRHTADLWMPHEVLMGRVAYDQMLRDDCRPNTRNIELSSNHIDW